MGRTRGRIFRAPPLVAAGELVTNPDGSTTRHYMCGCFGTLWPDGRYKRSQCDEHRAAPPMQEEVEEL